MKLVIDKSNVNSSFNDKFRSVVIHSSSVWHKVMVENAQVLERDFVLKTIMTVVHPLDFVPVSYEVCPEYVSFLIKNCGAALERLCQRNLVVPNPYNKDKPFFLSIELCFAHANELKVNVQSNIASVIKKRLSADGVLNLEQFYKDPNLLEFCPLSQPKIMFFILHLSKTYNVKVLKLGNNQIEVLKPLEAIHRMKSLVCLDLRNNNISNVSELKELKLLSISELWLDGNPVCEKYDEFSYGRAMQQIINGLVKLDGFPLMTKGGFLPFRRNFLCNIEGQELVDQFLEHYFTLYDSPDRNVLSEVYHKQAMFSLTSRYLTNQSTSQQNTTLEPYKQLSRNIKQISNFSMNDLHLFKGPQSILKILNSLPRTEHDPHTFTVDLMTYTDTTAVIVVTGVFEECSKSGLSIERQYGFVRTFVLLAGQNSEYQIVNEQLHVSNATTIQTSNAFTIPRQQKLNYIKIPPPQNIEEKYELIEAMRIITGLSMEWSENYLEDTQYNLKDALTTFVELYKADQIPQNAFDRENETETLQQNTELQKIPETILVAKNSNKTFNKVNNTSAIKFDIEPVEQVPKIAQPDRKSETESALKNPVLHKLPKTNSNKRHKTSVNKFKLQPVSSPVEKVSKVVQLEKPLSSSSPKNITQQTKKANDCLLASSTISDNSEVAKEAAPSNSSAANHVTVTKPKDLFTKKKRRRRIRRGKSDRGANMEKPLYNNEKPENVPNHPEEAPLASTTSTSEPDEKELEEFISKLPAKIQKQKIRVELANGEIKRIKKLTH